MLTYATPTNTLITLASLAQASARESRVVDNTSTRYDDVQFQLWYNVTAGTISDDKCVYVYFYGSDSSGGVFPSMPAVTGSDAAIVMAIGSNYNLNLSYIINAINTATTMRGNPISIGQAFGGVLPPYWGFVVYNRTTLAFDPTEGSHGHTYRGIYYVGT